MSLYCFIFAEKLGYFLLRIRYRMMRALSDSQLLQVEAVYLILFGSALPDEIKVALVQRLAEVDYSMLAYLYWLVFRWQPFFCKGSEPFADAIEMKFYFYGVV